MMENTENTRSEGQDYRERVAKFTALTAVTPAIAQTDAQAFQAAMWTFTVIDNA